MDIGASEAETFSTDFQRKPIRMAELATSLSATIARIHRRATKIAEGRVGRSDGGTEEFLEAKFSEMKR